MFGHPIELNFDKKGTTHNTFLGGFLSIFIRLGLFVYVVVIFMKMFTYGNNMERSSTFTLAIDASEQQSVSNIKYGEMNSHMFLVFRW